MKNEARATQEARIQAIARDIMEHFRNLLMVVTLLALGLVARNRAGDLFGSSLLKGSIGWGVIAVGAALALLNLWAGVNRLKQWKHWKLWSALLFATYVLITARVIEVMVLIRLNGK